MTLDRVLLDSAVFIYAVGGDHPYRAPCRSLVRALGDNNLDGHASVLAVQELLHQRWRRTGSRQSAVVAARAVAAFCTLHPLDPDDLTLAIGLFERVQGLDAADACHAATALRRSIPVIISPDHAFDGVDGIVRTDPIDAAATLP